MTLYVVFGGVTGAGMGGVVKLFPALSGLYRGQPHRLVAERGVTPFWGGSPTCARRPAWTRSWLSGGADAFHTRFLSLVARGPLRRWDPASSLLGVLYPDLRPGHLVRQERLRRPEGPSALSSRPSVSPHPSSASMRRTTSPRRRYRPWPPSGRPSPRAYGDGLPPLRLSPMFCGKPSALPGGRRGAGHPLHHHRGRRFRSPWAWLRSWSTTSSSASPAGWTNPQDGSGGHPHHHYRGPALQRSLPYRSPAL